MKINLSFIPQNTALKGVKNIGLYDSHGNKSKTIPLGNLAPKSTGNILYTFGALSDVHLTVDTGPDDFVRALNYLNSEEKVDFICISGDMGTSGTDAEWASYKNYVDTYSPNTPVHISAGNHDAGQSARKSYDYPIPYTGNPLYYSFTQGDDVFIIFGMSLMGDPPFTNESLQWLYETLEANRNKRCFVFEHFMRYNGCGNANGTYYADNLNNTNGKVFLSLMEHYKNVLWFHGHSHTKFNVQEVMPSPIANYDRMFGCHSIHVPSLCYPRDKDMNPFNAESEGYVVDVYKNGIHLRGRDFVAGKFLPIASYWIDTTIEEIEEKTYVDSRGVIDTGSDTPSDDIVIFDKSEIGLNERFSSNHGKVVEAGGVICINTPVEPNTTYKITYSGAKTDIRGTYDKMYLVSSVGVVSYPNGASNIAEMTEGVVYNTDYTGVEVTFTTEADTANIWLSILFNPLGTYISNADELTDVVLTLEKINNSNDGITLPEGTTYTLNARESFTTKSTSSENGMVLYQIPCEPNTDYTLLINNKVPLNAPSGSVKYSTMFGYDENKTNAYTVTGSNTIREMTSEYITYANEKATATITFTTTEDMHFIMLSLVVSGTGAITEDDIKDIIITLEPDGITLPENSELVINKRFSGTGNTIVDGKKPGIFSVFIPIEGTDGTSEFTLKMKNLPIPITKTWASGSLDNHTIYLLNENKQDARNVEGRLASEGIRNIIGELPDSIVTDNGTSAEIKFVPAEDRKYAALTIRVNETGVAITEDDIKDIIITLEKIYTVNYTNLLPLSVDADGNDFVGTNGEDGYITGYRIRSNGILVEQDNTCASGFIPVEKYDIIRVANVTYTGNDTNERVVFYNSSKEFISQMGYTGNSILEKGDVYVFKAHIQGYMRFSANIINKKTIVTINEVITEEKLATNLLPLAVNEDGTDFVGTNGEDGYITGYRIRSNGILVEEPDTCATGFIPVTANCRIRVCGIKQCNLSETDDSFDRIAFYDNTKTCIGQTTLIKTNDGMTMEDDNATYNFDPGYWVAGTAFIRLSTGVIDENTIVTMNEPIIIDTSEEEPPVDTDIIVIDNSKIVLDGRYSQSNGTVVETGGVLGINIDVKPNTTYKLKYTGAITDITASYDRLYILNAEGTVSAVNGNTSISGMTQGTVYNSDNTGVEVTFTTYADTTNIWFNILFKEAGQYIKSVDQIANVVCTIQEIN